MAIGRVSQSGLPYGVFRRRRGRFGACAKHNNRTVHLGTYDTAEEANAAAVQFRAANPALCQERTVDEQFEAFTEVDPKTGCVIWTGGTDTGGYGTVITVPGGRGKGRRERAHRAAWIRAGLSFPDDKPFLLHSCDRPACVAIPHLRPGTHQENMRDMVQRARGHRSKTGLPFGVTRLPGGTYASQIRCGEAQMFLGCFATWQEACAIAFYHKNRFLYPELHG